MTCVLMVSTNWEIPEAFTEFLPDFGYEITWVQSVAEGVFHATHMRFDLVLIEFRLRREFVFDLAQALTIYDPSLPLIVFSTMILPQDEIRFAPIPFKAIVHLPVSLKHLINEIERYARV